jgi:zinc transport system substrate-binding protein
LDLLMEKLVKTRITILIYSCLCLLLFVSPCVAAQKPIVFVSIVPQKFFVQQISKDLLDVEVMVQPGASPATYEPKPSQMAKLSSCSVYLAIGVPFERAWLGKFSAVNPSMRVVHTEKGIEKIAMAEHFHDQGEQSNERGGHGEERHAQGILDPHIWLSPLLVRKQAAVILETLKEITPQHGAAFDLNYLSFMEKIDRLDSEIRTLLKGKEGMQFMVFHPSWGYFAKEFGLQQVAIEMEGKEPKPSQLREIIHHARENGIRVIFVQRQFSLKNAKVVAREVHAEVVPVDPLAEDWIDNLRDVANKIKLAVK